LYVDTYIFSPDGFYGNVFAHFVMWPFIYHASRTGRDCRDEPKRNPFFDIVFWSRNSRQSLPPWDAKATKVLKYLVYSGVQLEIVILDYRGVSKFLSA